MWGDAFQAKKEKGKVEEIELKKREKQQLYSRPDNWPSENKPSLLLFLSSAECCAVADVIVPIVSHKAVRNVWLALWETPLQGPQLSQPGDLNPAREFNGWGAGRARYAFLLKDGKLWENLMWNQKQPALIFTYTLTISQPLNPSHTHLNTHTLSFFPCCSYSQTFFSSSSSSSSLYFSSSFLFSNARPHSALNKQSSLCGESFPSRFLKECCFPSSISPWLLGNCWESHFTLGSVWDKILDPWPAFVFLFLSRLLCIIII